jgi:zinc/manganese transport system ATP-binding protein
MCTGVSVKVEIHSVTVKRGDKVVFRRLTALFNGPALYQVIGPNGSGKTTLLLTIIGRIKPIEGRVFVNDVTVSGPGSVKGLVSYMPQQYSIPIDAPITLYEFIENIARFSEKSISVEEALKLAGVNREHWFKRLSQLSGGLLQRAMLARALVLDTPIMLLDEPFSNIDPEGKVDLSEYIGELSKKKLLVVANHDPTLLLDYTDKILVLGHGDYAYGSVNDILKLEVLDKFYKKCAFELRKHVHIVDWH